MPSVPAPLRHRALVLALLLSAPWQLGAQPRPAITVTGDVPRSLTLTASDLAALPRTTVSTTSNGITTNYEGVLLGELLTRAGIVLGPGARGGSLSAYVIAIASDGYQVVFSVGELDPAITDGRYLVADKANGEALFGENGAFRLVIPGDKRGARSLRMLSTVKVVQVPRS